MIQTMMASAISPWTMTETMGAVSTLSRSFVNSDITRTGVPYCHGEARADCAQRAHPRGARPGRNGALFGPGRGRHLGRADRRGCRSVAPDLLSPLPLQARLAVCRLHRAELVSRRAGRQSRRRTD